VRGPAVIGENCTIENCYIGPYSSISDRAHLVDVDLDHSVVLEAAEIVGVTERIIDSVIGQRVKLHVGPKRPKALRFMIGDDSHIELT